MIKSRDAACMFAWVANSAKDLSNVTYPSVDKGQPQEINANGCLIMTSKRNHSRERADPRYLAGNGYL